MTEKPEWELLDAPPQGARPKLRDILKALLGPHWRWKMFGAALVASLALTLMLMLAGVAVVLIVAGTLLSFGIGKLRRWLGRERRVVIR